MSAIVAGKACKGCGQSHWVSLGSPKWWYDVAIKGQPPSENYKNWDRWRRSGKCLDCYHADLVAYKAAKEKRKLSHV